MWYVRSCDRIRKPFVKALERYLGGGATSLVFDSSFLIRILERGVLVLQIKIFL